ncbi:ABC transporter, putative, partial [Bodo saltans]
AWTAHHVDPISSAASEDRAFLDAQNEISWNGASFLSQIRIAHVRYIEKQLTLLSSLFVEMGVALILGVILGFSQMDNEVVGYFVYPFARISSIPLTQMTAQMHMYAFMSLGLATGTAGVNVFVNDKSTYSRAVASGSSRIAHYIGSVTASWYRLVVVTLAFTAPYHLMSKSSAPYGQYFALFFVFSWVMYAIAGIIALLAEQRTAALVSRVVAILFACFSGSIKFPTGIKKISFCFWAAQVLQQWVYQDTTNVYEETSTQFGWELNDESTTFGVMIAMGVVYHMIGCMILISHGQTTRKSRGRNVRIVISGKATNTIPTVLQQSDAEKWFRGKRGSPRLEHAALGDSEVPNDTAAFTNLLLQPYQNLGRGEQASQVVRELDLI